MNLSDIKSILLVASFIVPFVLAIVIMILHQKNRLHQLVVAGLLNASLVFFINFFYFEGFTNLYYWFNSLHVTALLFVFPLIYFIIKQLILNTFCRKELLRHLTPGIAIGLFSSVLLYGFTTGEAGVHYFEHYRSGTVFDDATLRILTIVRIVNVAVILLQIAFYMFTILRIPAQLKKQLLNEYSYDTQIDIRWIKGIAIIVTLLGVLCIMYYVFIPPKAHEDMFMIVFLFLISAIIIYISAKAMIFKTPDVEPISECNQDVEKTLNSKDEHLLNALINRMQHEKLYLKPDLSLQDLCAHFNTNRTYLSSLINRKLGGNFNYFVNNFRVNHVIEYAKRNPKVSAEQLAEIGGFGSVSSMRRAMKRLAESDSSQKKEE